MPDEIDQPEAFGLRDVSMDTDGVVNFGYNIGTVVVFVATLVGGLMGYNKLTEILGVQSEQDAPVDF